MWHVVQWHRIVGVKLVCREHIVNLCYDLILNVQTGKWLFKSKPAYLGISPEEAVWEGNPQVEVHGSQHTALHISELVPGVGVVTDVEEVIQGWWDALLGVGMQREEMWLDLSNIHLVNAKLPTLKALFNNVSL